MRTCTLSLPMVARGSLGCRITGLGASSQGNPWSTRFPWRKTATGASRVYVSAANRCGCSCGDNSGRMSVVFRESEHGATCWSPLYCRSGSATGSYCPVYRSPMIQIYCGTPGSPASSATCLRTQPNTTMEIVY